MPEVNIGQVRGGTIIADRAGVNSGHVHGDTTIAHHARGEQWTSTWRYY